MTEASDILEIAKKRYVRAKDAWQEIYDAAKADLHFISDKPNCQWDDKDVAERKLARRITLQIDQLGQFIHQVTNDIRMNTPTIKVLPVGDGADVETAEMLAGRCKAIEYKSNADAAYDLAADFSVKCSIGFITVDHDFVDDGGFEQELKINRVVNPFAILLDPDSTEPDGSDAKYGFIIKELLKAEFTELYPDAQPMSFGEADINKVVNDDDNILIVEYFEIDDESKVIGQLDDGTIEEVVDGVPYKTTRRVTKKTVRRFKLSGSDILHESTFPGKYVPIIPVYGEEAWENGKRRLHSLIRKSKSAQKMFNLWKSLETELLLKQPIAPVQAAIGQMRGFEDDWKTPDKAMVLYYHQSDAEGNPAPPPERLQPPTIPTGIVNAARETVEDIKATMGLYNTSLGKKSNETSGIAIQRRKQQGDVATFHFSDNLVRAVTHVGKILVSALPEVEDTPRIVQTVNAEEDMKPVGINGMMAEGQERPFFMGKGRFDVRVVTGPSFTTQRQEAAVMYQEALRILPPEAAVNVLDLVFKYQDAPGSQAMAARFKKMVNPQLLDESEREEGEVNPQIEQLQQQMQQMMQEAQQQIQMLQGEVQSKQGEYQLKQQELQIKAGDQQMKAQAEQLHYGLGAKKLLLEEKRLALEEGKIMLESARIEQELSVSPMGMAELENKQADTKVKYANAMKTENDIELSNREMTVKEFGAIKQARENDNAPE